MIFENVYKIEIIIALFDYLCYIAFMFFRYDGIIGMIGSRVSTAGRNRLATVCLGLRTPVLPER